MNSLKNIFNVTIRELGIMRKNHIYFFCMVVFPLLVLLFFTTLMGKGQPTKMPVGVVNQDNSPETRSIVRLLNSFQTTEIKSEYSTINEARAAIQNGDIYAFLYIPTGTTDKLVSLKQPKISFYYSSTTLLSGALLYKDLKTICILTSAGYAKKVLSAKGMSDNEIQTYLQPVIVDVHSLNNPQLNYNSYLSTMIIPGCLMLFIFLITVYSLGTELKFNSAKELMTISQNNIFIAVFGKMFLHFMIFTIIMLIYIVYVFGILKFPHQGSYFSLIFLGILGVLSAQGFGLFVFGLVPSLRLSMSVCSLWAVLSFSMSGTAFPTFAMDGPLEALAQLFPLRHYYMIYQINILNGYSYSYSIFNILALLAFILLPFATFWNTKRAMKKFVYIP